MRYFRILNVLLIFLSTFLCFSVTKAETKLTEYWNNFEFRNNPKDDPEFKILYRKYLSLIAESDSVTQAISIKNLLLKASLDNKILISLSDMLDLTYSYPKSQYKNKYICQSIYETMIDINSSNGDDIKIYTKKLNRLKLNSEGKIANDFEVVTPTGEHLYLQELDTDYTLLLFYDPDCETCKHLTNSISESQLLCNMINTKELSVFAVYLEKEPHKWLNFVNEKPNWIHGWDRNNLIDEYDLYYLESIPTIYLLDKEKKVIKKDCNFQELESWIKDKT